VRVAVLEDEPQLLALMVRIFERAGWHVRSAARGDESEAFLSDHPPVPDAVVVDMAIQPHGAGPVIASVASQSEPIGLVVVSGDLLDPDLQAPLEACGGIFLHKPFAPKALLDAVESAVVRCRSSERRGPPRA
jgi:DNA-binding response OmpR family regulator